MPSMLPNLATTFKFLPVFGAKAYSHRDAFDNMAHFRLRIMHARTGEPQPFTNEEHYHRVS